MADLEINLRVTPGVFRWTAVGLLLCGFTRDLSTESFTMTTSYPAPIGIYTRMITTGDTFLARDPGGKVGIGTTNPQALLDVNGAARFGSDVSAAGKVSAGDVQVGGQSVITNITCSGLTCARTGNNSFNIQ